MLDVLTQDTITQSRGRFGGAPIEEINESLDGGNLGHATPFMQTYLQHTCKLACAQAPQDKGMKTLGDQAKAFREARGWNTTEMANAIGTTRQNIESLEERGNRLPKYIGDLALLMGKSVDDMLIQAGLAKSALLQGRKTKGSPWPFKLVKQDQYDLLDDLEKGAVQQEMQRHIEALLSQRRSSRPGKLSVSRDGDDSAKAA